MRYDNIRRGTFLARPNRFIAHVRLDGGEPPAGCADRPLSKGAWGDETADFVICHVKNTGRCRELLIPGAAVYLQECGNPARKTKYDLIAVEKGTGDGSHLSVAQGATPPLKGRLLTGGSRLIYMDAQAPNKVFQEWAEAGRFLPGLTLLRPETTWGNSRFDFYYEQSPGGEGAAAAPGSIRRGFVEVKGVTLEEDSAVYFPDAPTERGVKHLEELIKAREAGFEAAVCFVIQMEGVAFFSPNDRTHPAFGDALRRAAAAGVRVLAYDCAVTPDSLTLNATVEVRL